MQSRTVDKFGSIGLGHRRLGQTRQCSPMQRKIDMHGDSILIFATCRGHGGIDHRNDWKTEFTRNAKK